MLAGPLSVETKGCLFFLDQLSLDPKVPYTRDLVEHTEPQFSL